MRNSVIFCRHHRVKAAVRVNPQRFAAWGRVIVPAKKKPRPNMIKHPTRGWVRMQPNPRHWARRYFISCFAYPYSQWF